MDKPISRQWKWQQERMREKRCVICGKDVVPTQKRPFGGLYCATHLAYYNAKSQERRDKRKQLDQEKKLSRQN